MQHINHVQILGHTGGDPERHIARQGDSSFVTFSVATNFRWKDSEGAAQETTEWHRVIVNGPLADLVEQNVGKGDPVLVDGRLRTRKWRDSADIERSTTEIVASNVNFLSPRAWEGR